MEWSGELHSSNQVMVQHHPTAQAQGCSHVFLTGVLWNRMPVPGRHTLGGSVWNPKTGDYMGCCLTSQLPRRYVTSGSTASRREWAPPCLLSPRATQGCGGKTGLTPGPFLPAVPQTYGGMERRAVSGCREPQTAAQKNWVVPLALSGRHERRGSTLALMPTLPLPTFLGGPPWVRLLLGACGPRVLSCVAGQGAVWAGGPCSDLTEAPQQALEGAAVSQPFCGREGSDPSPGEQRASPA